MAKKRKEQVSATMNPETHQQEDEQQHQQVEEEEQEQTNEEEDPEEDPEEQPNDMNEDDHRDSEELENQHGTNTSIDEAPQKQANGGDEEQKEIGDEPVDKLLDPFSKEQLLLLLKDAVSRYPDFVESVQKLADADPAHRKIFVHGLGWDTTAETLTSEYEKYGKIEDCKVVVDKVSGKSKGYAFILFKHRSGAQRALKEPQKKIGNRITSCQLASAGPVPSPAPAGPPVSEHTQRKIFVSNVGADIDPQKLLEFFSKYGEIEDGPLGLDKQTGKPKGFAFFVYKSIESARKVLEEPHKNFESYVLHCQKAVDGPKPSKPFHQQHHKQYHHHPSKKSKYSNTSGGAGPGHLMAPSGPPAGYSPAAVTPSAALTPVLGQALTALLATQGAGLGLGNLLGGAGNQPVANNAGYGNQGTAGAGYGYAAQLGMQGGYQYPPPMGQPGSRPHQGGASYMGHGH